MVGTKPIRLPAARAFRTTAFSLLILVMSSISAFHFALNLGIERKTLVDRRERTGDDIGAVPLHGADHLLRQPGIAADELEGRRVAQAEHVMEDEDLAVAGRA